MHKNLKASILIVEDDVSISNVMSYNLKKEGYTVNVVNDGALAVLQVKDEKPDLVLLDWMLPGKSGIEICSALRNDPETTNTPIIMISSKSDNLDKVTGLERGADDYLTKPVSAIELIARIKAVLRRIRPAFANKKMQFEGLVVDLGLHKATINDREIKLSPIEFQILQLMMENPDRVLSRTTLIDKIWGMDVDVDERTIDVHMTRIRKAIYDNAENQRHPIVKSLRNIGYKLCSA